MDFEELEDFILNKMKMESWHNYQPIMIKVLNENKGQSSKEEIQEELHKLNTKYPKEHFTKYPFKILEDREIVEPKNSDYVLNAFKNYKNDQTKIDRITNLCDQNIRVCKEVNELKSFENKVDKTQLQVLEEILRIRGKSKSAKELGWSSGGSGLLTSKNVDKPYFFHPLGSGTYTPAKSDYVQSIFLSPKTKWGTEIDQKEYTLKINYDYGNSEGKQYTTDKKNMIACKKLGLPIGVFFKLKESKYRCLGLGKIVEIEKNNFVIRSFGITDEESHKLKTDVLYDYARYYEREHRQEIFRNHPPIDWEEFTKELGINGLPSGNSSDLNTTKKSLNTVLLEVNEENKGEKGKWVLPEFQRTFKWKAENVRELLESVFRGYYIGTILLWNVSDDDTRKKCNSFPIEGVKNISKNFTEIILDGQQRITSLNYAINTPEIGENHPGFFYIDLRGFLKNDEEKMVLHNKKELEPNDTFERLLFPFKYLLKPNEWIKPFKRFLKEQNQWSEEFEDQIIDPLREKIDEIKNFEISTIELDKVRFDVIVNIFEKVNTTGKPLDVFALMNNRMSVHGINLTRELLPDTEKTYPKIKAYNKKMETEIFRYIMESISLSYSNSKSCKRADILDMYDNMVKDDNWTPDKFVEMWKNISKFTHMAIEKLENTDDGFGVSSPRVLPYEPMLPVLTSLIQQIKENNLDEIECDEKIRKWYWISVFDQRYSQGVEGRKTSDFKLMAEWFVNDNKIPKFVTDFETHIHRIEFEDVKKPKSAIYRGILCLIKKRGASDPLIVYDDTKTNQMDHIFARKSEIKNPLKESILNFTWLTKITNIKKSNKMPKEYFEGIRKKHYKNSDSKLQKVLFSHLINEDGYDALMENNFDGFIESRKEEFLKAIADETGIKHVNKINYPTQTSPKTPFSNQVILMDAYEKCKKEFLIVSQYFATGDLKLILGVKDRLDVKKMRLLTSKIKADKTLKSFFKDFRKEMENQYGIKCEMRVMSKEVEREQHARYLSDPKNCWKMYDQSTAKRGTSDSVVPCERPKNLEKWWDESFDIIEDWNKFYEE